MEPQTTAKVVLNTTKGPIEVELFAREVPEACKRFVTLCKNGFYDKQQFTHIIPLENIQCGDGIGTDSYPTFPDEPHTRIRLKRGYLGMVPAYKDGRRVKDSNRTEFFIALKQIPFNGGSIFGKVVGDTIYNAQDISKVDLDDQGQPLFSQHIESTTVVIDYFDTPNESAEAGESNGGLGSSSGLSSAPKSAKPLKRKLKTSYNDDEDEEEEVFTKKSVSAVVEKEFKAQKDVSTVRDDHSKSQNSSKSAATAHVTAESDDVIDSATEERLEAFRNMKNAKQAGEAKKEVLISRQDRLRRRLGLGSDDEVPSDASDPSSDDDDFDIFAHRFICPEDVRGEDSLVTLEGGDKQ